MPNDDIKQELDDVKKEIVSMQEAYEKELRIINERIDAIIVDKFNGK